jgi:hypothetical protein
MAKRTLQIEWAVPAVLAAMMLTAIGPASAQGPFGDVPAGHPAYAAVNELAKEGFVNGYPDSSYGGNRAMTRWEFAQALWRVVMRVEENLAQVRPAHAHSPSPVASPEAGLFADVPTDSSRGEVLRDLGSRGILQGYPDQTFAGGRTVTVAEAGAALRRTLQWVERELAANRSKYGPIPVR